jgi:hypothetical protein
MKILPSNFNCFSLVLVLLSDQPHLYSQNIFVNHYILLNRSVPTRQSSSLRFAPSPAGRASRPPRLPPSPLPSQTHCKTKIKSRAPELELGFLGPRLKTEALASYLVAFHKSLYFILMLLFLPPSDNHLSCRIVL